MRKIEDLPAPLHTGYLFIYMYLLAHPSLCTAQLCLGKGEVTDGSVMVRVELSGAITRERTKRLGYRALAPWRARVLTFETERLSNAYHGEYSRTMVVCRSSPIVQMRE